MVLIPVTELVTNIVYKLVYMIVYKAVYKQNDWRWLKWDGIEVPTTFQGIH